MSPYFNKKYLN